MGVSMRRREEERSTDCGWVDECLLDVSMFEEHIAPAHSPQHPLKSTQQLTLDHTRYDPREQTKHTEIHKQHYRQQ